MFIADLREGGKPQASHRMAEGHSLHKTKYGCECVDILEIIDPKGNCIKYLEETIKDLCDRLNVRHIGSGTELFKIPNYPEQEHKRMTEGHSDEAEGFILRSF
jgi:hypothetical protein